MNDTSINVENLIYYVLFVSNEKIIANPVWCEGLGSHPKFCNTVNILYYTVLTKSEFLWNIEKKKMLLMIAMCKQGS